MESGWGVPGCQALVEMWGEGCRGVGGLWDKSGEWGNTGCAMREPKKGAMETLGL